MIVWSMTTMAVAVKPQGRYEEALDLTRTAVRLAFDGANDSARMRHPNFIHGMVLCDCDLMDDATVAFRKAATESVELESAWIVPDLHLVVAELRFLLGSVTHSRSSTSRPGRRWLPGRATVKITRSSDVSGDLHAQTHAPRPVPRPKGIEMQSVAFAAPILPGKTESDRAAMRSCAEGERKEAHHASRERRGITRESVWIQQTPGGDVAVVYLEADDIQTAMAGLGDSPDPFDSWFREHILETHGIDLANDFPPPDQVIDFRR
jgi:hypothetical protein